MADLKKLKSISVDKTSEFRKLNGTMRATAVQRKYNVHVAMRLLLYIDEHEGMNQTALAKLLNVSPAFVSKVINCKVNLSLDTVSEYEQKLNGYSLLAGSAKGGDIKEISVVKYKSQYQKKRASHWAPSNNCYGYNPIFAFVY